MPICSPFEICAIIGVVIVFWRWIVRRRWIRAGCRNRDVRADRCSVPPSWEHNPWTLCSVSCGGGSQERSVMCVEEDIHGQISQVEEWKCTYSPQPEVKQSCNTFECPQWMAMEWSQVSALLWISILYSEHLLSLSHPPCSHFLIAFGP